MIEKIISTINRLVQTDDVYNKEDILMLYEAVLDTCNDKENYQTQSAHIIEMFNNSTVSDNVVKEWVHYSSAVFASYFAVKLYSDRDVSMFENPDIIEKYFREGNFSIDIKAFGLYAYALTLCESNAKKCYDLTNEAFELNSELASFIDVKYVYDKNVKHITEECPLCGGTEASPHYCSQQVLKLNNRKSFPPAKLWMKCKDCGNYYTYDFPVMKVGQINGHYTKSNKNEELQNRFPLHMYNEIFNRIGTFTKGKDYLEIGVGNGEMLAVAQEFGYNTDAIEICKEDCEKISAALDIDIKWCDVVEYNTDKKYDVIIMGDVFEHVTKPVQVLKKAKEMLKDGGVLWLSTPNYNCGYARMQKFKHCMWHELNHYTYVSFESLKEILDKMDMEVVSYDISARYIGSMELCIMKKK